MSTSPLLLLLQEVIANANEIATAVATFRVNMIFVCASYFQLKALGSNTEHLFLMYDY